MALPMISNRAAASARSATIGRAAPTGAPDLGVGSLTGSGAHFTINSIGPVSGGPAGGGGRNGNAHPLEPTPAANLMKDQSHG